MKVLVTGASGFVAKSLIANLKSHGVTVVGAGRKLTQSKADVFFVIPDITSPEAWRKALTDCEVVIHLLARVHVMSEFADDPMDEYRRVNVQGTERLARSSAASGVKRLVYVSTIKVNGEETLESKSYSELDAPSPRDAYGMSKWEAEQALHRVSKETGLEVVIVRPPLVYGAGVKANFAQMLNFVSRCTPLPLASVKNRRDMVYVGNLVDVLILCTMHPKAAGQTYLVSDGVSVSTPELICMLAKALGRRCFVFPFPIFVIKFIASLFGKSAAVDRLTQSLQIDDSKIRNELGWKPPFTMVQGLQATADWYMGRYPKK